MKPIAWNDGKPSGLNLGGHGFGGLRLSKADR
jgi:hypothetical protein